MAPENLGILVYGRNIGLDTQPEGEKLMREVLKTARTQPKEKKEMRTKADVKEEEIDMLQDKYSTRLHLYLKTLPLSMQPPPCQVELEFLWCLEEGICSRHVSSSAERHNSA